MNASIALAVVVVLTVLQSLLASPLVNNDIKAGYTTDDCPPGIWVCKKNMVEQPQPAETRQNIANPQEFGIKHDDDCPPGIWTCKKKRQNVPQPIDFGIKHNDDCPPGIWTCRKKRGVELANKRLEQLKRWIKEKAEREAQMMMNAAAKPSSAKQTRRSSNDCPPGIWVC